MASFKHQARFTWGSQQLDVEEQMRNKYIKALRDADKYDYSALAKFVRS